MKIYISGKISGLPEKEYKTNFILAAIEAQYYRYFDCKETVNPCNIKPFLGIKTWFFYMIADIRELLKCDAIYMQRNWMESRGARIELAVSVLTNKNIYFQ